MGNRRSYTQEFKDDAVRLVLSGKNSASVARDLGVDVSNINRWKQEYLKRQDAGHKGTGPIPSELAEENRRLRRELAEQKQINEILKKTIKYVS
jgi:transposase